MSTEKKQTFDEFADEWEQEQLALLRKRRAAKAAKAAKPKAIVAEVGPRMFEAVKAKPEKLRLVAEDAEGNAVIDRPYRERPPQDKRFVPDRPQSAVGQIKWGHAPWGGGINNPSWDSAGERADRFVQRNYDIFACLRERDND